MILLFYFLGPFYSRMFIPLFAHEIEWIRPGYKVQELALKDGKRMSYIVAAPVIIPRENGKTAIAEAELRGSALVSFLYINPIILFSILLAWPTLSIKDKAWSFMISLPFLAVITLIDMPFHLLYLMETDIPVLTTYDRIIVLWGKILNNGGRQFLSILVALLSIAPHYLLKPVITVGKQVGRNDPCPCGSGKKYKKCCMLK